MNQQKAGSTKFRSFHIPNLQQNQIKFDSQQQPVILKKQQLPDSLKKILQFQKFSYHGDVKNQQHKGQNERIQQFYFEPNEQNQKQNHSLTDQKNAIPFQKKPYQYYIPKPLGGGTNQKHRIVRKQSASNLTQQQLHQKSHIQSLMQKKQEISEILAKNQIFVDQENQQRSTSDMPIQRQQPYVQNLIKQNKILKQQSNKNKSKIDISQLEKQKVDYILNEYEKTKDQLQDQRAKTARDNYLKMKRESIVIQKKFEPYFKVHFQQQIQRYKDQLKSKSQPPTHRKDKSQEGAAEDSTHYTSLNRSKVRNIQKNPLFKELLKSKEYQQQLQLYNQSEIYNQLLPSTLKLKQRGIQIFQKLVNDQIENEKKQQKGSSFDEKNQTFQVGTQKQTLYKKMLADMRHMSANKQRIQQQNLSKQLEDENGIIIGNIQKIIEPNSRYLRTIQQYNTHFERKTKTYKYFMLWARYTRAQYCQATKILIKQYNFFSKQFFVESFMEFQHMLQDLILLKPYRSLTLLDLQKYKLSQLKKQFYIQQNENEEIRKSQRKLLQKKLRNLGAKSHKAKNYEIKEEFQRVESEPSEDEIDDIEPTSIQLSSLDILTLYKDISIDYIKTHIDQAFQVIIEGINKLKKGSKIESARLQKEQETIQWSKLNIQQIGTKIYRSYKEQRRAFENKLYSKELIQANYLEKLILVFTRQLIYTLEHLRIQNQLDLASDFFSNKGGNISSYADTCNPLRAFEIKIYVEDSKIKQSPNMDQILQALNKLFECLDNNLKSQNKYLQQIFDMNTQSLSANYLSKKRKWTFKKIQQETQTIFENKIYVKYKASLSKIVTTITNDFKNLDNSLKEYYNANFFQLRAQIEQEFLSISPDLNLDNLIERNRNLNNFQQSIYQLSNFQFSMVSLIINLSLILIPLNKEYNKAYQALNPIFVEKILQECKQMKRKMVMLTKLLDRLPKDIEDYLMQIQQIEFLKKGSLLEIQYLQKLIQTGIELAKLNKMELILNTEIIFEENNVLIEKLPKLIYDCETRLSKEKNELGFILNGGFQTLYKKIRDFIQKYCRSYLLEGGSKLESSAYMIFELEKRDQTLNEMKQMLDHFYNSNAKLMIHEQNQILKDEQLRLEQKVLNFYEMAQTLHCMTKNLWHLIDDWNKFQHQNYSTQFLMMNVENSITSNQQYKQQLFLCKEQFLVFGKGYEKYDEDPKMLNEIEDEKILFEFNLLLNDIISKQSQKTDHFEQSLNSIIHLFNNKQYLQPNHWDQISALLNNSALMNHCFTLQELLVTDFRQFLPQIDEIIVEATKQIKFIDDFEQVKCFWQNALFQITPFQNRVDVFVINNFNILNIKLEEAQFSIQRYLSDNHLKEMIGENELTLWKQKLTKIQQILQQWEECQELYIQLEKVITYADVQQALEMELQKYVDSFQQYRSLMWQAQKQQSVQQNVFVEQRSHLFNCCIANAQKFKIIVQQYVDKQKNLFPRLTLLSDEQFFELCEQLENCAGQASSQNIDTSLSPLLREIFAGCDRLNIVFINSKETIKNNILEIRGMISADFEYLNFLNSIPVSFPVYQHLQQIEEEMQKCIIYQTNQAVQYFPNLSLDEWILDYPLQTILTSIHLIITHEIDEMIKHLNEHCKKEKKIKKNLKQINQSQSEQSFDDSNESSQNLLQSSSQNQKQEEQQNNVEEADSQPSVQQMMFKPEKEQIGIMINQFDQIDNEEIIELFGKEIYFNKKYLAASKEENIDILQQKTFRGLLFRLQFWIKQISNLIYSQTVEEINFQNISFRKSKNIQQILMFIVYMRDIVIDVYETSSYQQIIDYEWSKHVRLEHDIETGESIVKCGGWSGYQGNEYLGSCYRQLITPICAKYFIFLSSALREKSGVAFRTTQQEPYCQPLISEFANICTIYMKTIYTNRETNFNYLKQIISGSMYSSCWLLLELVNELQLKVLQNFTKEALLLQQKYILSEINNEPNIMHNIMLRNQNEQEQEEEEEEESILNIENEEPSEIVAQEKQIKLDQKVNITISMSQQQQDMNKQQQSMEKFMQQNYKKQENESEAQQKQVKEQYQFKKVSYGLFCSYSIDLLQHQHKNFKRNYNPNQDIEEILKSGFRTSAFLAPNREYMFQNYLFVLGIHHSKYLGKQLNMFINVIEEYIQNADNELILKQIKLPLTNREGHQIAQRIQLKIMNEIYYWQKKSNQNDEIENFYQIQEFYKEEPDMNSLQQAYNAKIREIPNEMIFEIENKSCAEILNQFCIEKYLPLFLNYFHSNQSFKTHRNSKSIEFKNEVKQEFFSCFQEMVNNVTEQTFQVKNIGIMTEVQKGAHYKFNEDQDFLNIKSGVFTKDLVRRIMFNFRKQRIPEQIQCIHSLHQVLQSYSCAILIGPQYSGKQNCIKLLGNSLQKLYELKYDQQQKLLDLQLKSRQNVQKIQRDVLEVQIKNVIPEFFFQNSPQSSNIQVQTSNNNRYDFLTIKEFMREEIRMKSEKRVTFVVFHCNNINSNTHSNAKFITEWESKILNILAIQKQHYTSELLLPKEVVYQKFSNQNIQLNEASTNKSFRIVELANKERVLIPDHIHFIFKNLCLKNFSPTFIMQIGVVVLPQNIDSIQMIKIKTTKFYQQYIKQILNKLIKEKKNNEKIACFQLLESQFEEIFISIINPQFIQNILQTVFKQQQKDDERNIILMSMKLIKRYMNLFWLQIVKKQLLMPSKKQIRGWIAGIIFYSLATILTLRIENSQQEQLLEDKLTDHGKKIISNLHEQCIYFNRLLAGAKLSQLCQYYLKIDEDVFKQRQDEENEIQNQKKIKFLYLLQYEHKVQKINFYKQQAKQCPNGIFQIQILTKRQQLITQLISFLLSGNNKENNSLKAMFKPIKFISIFNNSQQSKTIFMKNIGEQLMRQQEQNSQIKFIIHSIQQKYYYNELDKIRNFYPIQSLEGKNNLHIILQIEDVSLQYTSEKNKYFYYYDACQIFQIINKYCLEKHTQKFQYLALKENFSETDFKALNVSIEYDEQHVGQLLQTIFQSSPEQFFHNNSLQFTELIMKVGSCLNDVLQIDLNNQSSFKKINININLAMRLSQLILFNRTQEIEISEFNTVFQQCLILILNEYLYHSTLNINIKQIQKIQDFEKTFCNAISQNFGNSIEQIDQIPKRFLRVPLLQDSWESSNKQKNIIQYQKVQIQQPEVPIITLGMLIFNSQEIVNQNQKGIISQLFNQPNYTDMVQSILLYLRFPNSHIIFQSENGNFNQKFLKGVFSLSHFKKTKLISHKKSKQLKLQEQSFQSISMEGEINSVTIKEKFYEKQLQNIISDIFTQNIKQDGGNQLQFINYIVTVEVQNLNFTLLNYISNIINNAQCFLSQDFLNKLQIKQNSQDYFKLVVDIQQFLHFCFIVNTKQEAQLISNSFKTEHFRYYFLEENNQTLNFQFNDNYFTNQMYRVKRENKFIAQIFIEATNLLRQIVITDFSKAQLPGDKQNQDYNLSSYEKYHKYNALHYDSIYKVSANFFSRSRFALFHKVFKFLFELFQKQLQELEKNYEIKLESVKQFQKFQNRLSDYSNLIYFQMQQLNARQENVQSNMILIKKDLKEKIGIINEKSRECDEYSMNIQELQHRIDVALQENLNEIQDVLEHIGNIHNDQIQFIHKNFEQIQQQSQYKVLEAVALLITNSLNAINRSDFVLKQFLNKFDLIQKLKALESIELDYITFSEFSSRIDSIKENTFLEQGLITFLYKFCKKFTEKILLYQKYSQEIQRIEDLKKILDANQKAIIYNKQIINELQENYQKLQNEFDEILQEKELKIPLLKETSQQQQEQAIFVNGMMNLESKLIKKLKWVKQIKNDTFIVDIFFIAFRLVYLGVFTSLQRNFFTNQLIDSFRNSKNPKYKHINIGVYWAEEQKNNINIKEAMSMLQFQKILLKALKLHSEIKAELKFINVISHENLYELLISFLSLNPNKIAIFDNIGEFEFEFLSIYLRQITNLQNDDSNEQQQNEIQSTSEKDEIDKQQDTSQQSLNNSLLQQQIKSQHYNDYIKRISLLEQNNINLFKEPFIFHSNQNYNALLKQQVLFRTTHQNASIIMLKSNDNYFQSRNKNSYDSILNEINNKALISKQLLSCHLSEINTNDAWMEIKETLLTYLMHEQAKKLMQLKTSFFKNLKKLNKAKDKLQQILENQVVQLQEKFESIDQNGDNNNELENLKRQSELLIEEIKQMHFKVQTFKDQKEKILLAIDEIYNEHPLLASYANILVIMYDSHLQIFQMVNSNLLLGYPYTWSHYQTLIGLLLKKLIRDISNEKIEQQKREKENKELLKEQQKLQKLKGQKKNQSEEYLQCSSLEQNKSNIQKEQKENESEVTIDEEFFHCYVLPGMWACISAKLPFQYTSLFNLIFALKVGIKKQSLSVEQMEIFMHYFVQREQYQIWKEDSDFITVVPPNLAKNMVKDLFLLKNMIQEKKAMTESLDDLFNMAFNVIVDQKSMESQDQQGIISQNQAHLEHMLQQQSIEIPLFCKILISLVGHGSHLKSRLMQLVHEELSSIFEFNNEAPKFYNFIKLSSWHIPVAIFSQANVNVINTICSIASYYSVEMDVIEEELIDLEVELEYFDVVQKSSIKKDQNLCDLNRKKQRIEASNKIHANQIKEAALKGSWLLISTKAFPTFWTLANEELMKLRIEDKIVNSFRLIFNFQNLDIKMIPADFLSNQCVVFNLCSQNLEDMEGLNDVWAHILNEDLLKSLLQNKLPTIPQCNESFGIELDNIVSVNSTFIKNNADSNAAINQLKKNEMEKQNKLYTLQQKEQQQVNKNLVQLKHQAQKNKNNSQKSLLNLDISLKNLQTIASPVYHQQQLQKKKYNFTKNDTQDNNNKKDEISNIDNEQSLVQEFQNISEISQIIQDIQLQESIIEDFAQFTKL